MKKLIIVLGALVCVVGLIAAGVTIAWFTDTKEASNVFTAGDVEIRLTERDPSGELFDVSHGGIQLDYGHVYPGREVVKDSTVTNIGSEAAYIAVEIYIWDGEEDINSALGIPGAENGLTPLDHFFEGGIWGESFTRTSADGATMVEYESASYIVQYDTRLTDGFWINIFVKETLASGNSLLLWKGFTFPSTWGNEQMLQCADLNISTKVFAAQSSGFTDCETAITTSFGEDFGLPQ